MESTQSDDSGRPADRRPSVGASPSSPALDDVDQEVMARVAPRMILAMPELVESVDSKLVRYVTAWRRSMTPGEPGVGSDVEGPMEQAGLGPPREERQGHLARYLGTLITRPFARREMLAELEALCLELSPMAGASRLGEPGDCVNGLLSAVADAITDAVQGMGLDDETRRRALAVFGALLAAQNAWYRSAGDPAAAERDG